MRPTFIIFVLAALAACAPQNNETSQSSAISSTVKVPVGAYTLDKTHASLIFRVSHMGFSNYTASFQKFDAQLQFDPANLAASSVAVTIDPRSLTLDNPPAGFVDDLLGAQWLDAGQFPQMSFRSTKIEVTAPNTLHITGDLALHGVTKPIMLDAIFNGGYAGQPMDPHARIGFSAQGTFKRSDFGIASGIPKAGSTMGVGDEVEVVIEAEFSGPPLATAVTDQSVAPNGT